MFVYSNFANYFKYIIVHPINFIVKYHVLITFEFFFFFKIMQLIFVIIFTLQEFELMFLTIIVL